jgi:signal transduction histidine kinase
MASTVVVAIGLLVAGTTLQLLLHRSLLTHVDDVADTQLADIAALIRQGTLPAELANAGDDGAAVQVVDGDGRLLAVSAGTTAVVPSIVPDGTDVEVQTRGNRRISAQRVDIGAGPRTIYVSTSLEPVDEAMARLRGALLVVGPLLLLFVAGTTWFVIGRALEPVEAIRARVAGISDRSLDERVPERGTEDEIGRLARTMNAMLDRVERGVLRQRAFVGDASHELQTPLASLRANLEVALAHLDGDQWPSIGEDLLATTLTMERLVHDLLYLARLDDGAALPVAPLDLDAIVLEECTVLRSRSGLSLDTLGVSAAAVIGRRDDLARVVRNLLENAVRHAASAVTVSLTMADGVALLAVADDGPGIPRADRERVFERFVRLDDARTRASGGTGLGLAIAREVVVAHGGSIEITDAGVVVRLPSSF